MTAEGAVNGKQDETVKHWRATTASAEVPVTEWLNSDATLIVSCTDFVASMNTLSTFTYAVDFALAPVAPHYSVNTQADCNAFSDAEVFGEDITYYDVSSLDHIDASYTDLMNDLKFKFTMDGVYTVRVTATDRSGNSTARSVVVRIDKTAPAADAVQVTLTDLISDLDVRTVGDLATLKYRRELTGGAMAADFTISGPSDPEVHPTRHDIVYKIASDSDTTVTDSDWTNYNTSAELMSDLNTRAANTSFRLFVKVTDDASAA